MVPLGKDSIEVEHIFTLQQSMPIFANVEWGGDVWQQISRRILSRQFALGDTRQNLIAVPEHIHRIKSQYFNKMAGIDGRKFFTDDVINEYTLSVPYDISSATYAGASERCAVTDGEDSSKTKAMLSFSFSDDGMKIFVAQRGLNGVHNSFVNRLDLTSAYDVSTCVYVNEIDDLAIVLVLIIII